MSQIKAVSIFVLFAIGFGIFGYFVVETGANIDDVVLAVAPQAEMQTAGPFFEESVTRSNLRKRYNYVTKLKAENPNAVPRMTSRERPVRILVVPGHDNDSKGTHFDGVDEVEFNRIVTNHLYDYLRQEPAFEVMRAHQDGEYHPDLLEHFETYEEEILEFREEHKEEMDELIEKGRVTTHSGVDHNFAASEVAKRLYGINHYANKNRVDLVIHVHFNDYRGRTWNKAGKYSGYSIYIPERQFSNARVSRHFAESIHKRLNLFWSSSDLPVESDVVIEDQDLIAIGSFNTLDAASVLIEYGYIYEGRFHNEEVSDEVFKEMAFQTYVGIKNFFDDEPQKVQTTLLPYTWETALDDSSGYSESALSLQAFLALSGYYPPVGYDVNSCPVTGYYGPCTESALAAFQKDRGIGPANGYLGPTTRGVLNNLIFE